MSKSKAADKSVRSTLALLIYVRLCELKRPTHDILETPAAYRFVGISRSPEGPEKRQKKSCFQSAMFPCASAQKYYLTKFPPPLRRANAMASPALTEPANPRS